MEDFEKRISEAHNDEERERVSGRQAGHSAAWLRAYDAQLREQMNYLGGDAKHSVLVRGLDYALLAQQKAKLTGDQGLDDDDDLEGAYGSAATKQDDNGKVREEKVAASKFRPIGSSTGFKHVEKTEEAPEFIWRNGKRMRRKKKPVAEERQREGEQVQPTPPPPGRQSESSRQAAKMSQAVADSVTMPPPPSKAAKAVQDPDSKYERLEADQKRAKVEADQDGGHERLPERVQEMAPDEDGGESSSSGDDGADIFADAGRWNGLEDDSDDEDTAEIAAAAPAPSEAHVGPATRDWFSTDAKATEAGMDNATEQEVSVLPSSLSSILDTAQAAQESNAAQDGTSEEGDSDDGEKVVAARPERLEGFSDSVLGREGVRNMLEQKDDDKRGEQKRKRKRSRKGKGGYGSD